MTTIASLNTPHVWLQVDKTGTPVDGDSFSDIVGKLTPNTQKIVFLSHGWKTNIEDASNQYAPLWENVLKNRAATRDDTLLVCFNWPSKSFDPNFNGLLDDDQVNALSAGKARKAGDLSDETLDKIKTDTLDLFSGLEAAALDMAIEDAVKTKDPIALVKLLESHVTEGDDAEIGEQLSDLTKSRLNLKAAFKTLEEPKIPTQEGKAMGIGDKLAGLVKGPRLAAAKILNQITYYEMKKRAGKVGESVAKALGALSLPRKLELHLVGHSFGARLVTSVAANYPGNANLELKSVTLLQGAFSHNALSSEKNGFYHGAPANISGPIVITHTHNDKANYLAYFIASLLSQDKSKSIGAGADNPFGAMGANGAQHSDALATTVTDLDLSKAKIQNVLADAFIADHMAIGNETCGKLVAKVIDGYG